MKNKIILASVVMVLIIVPFVIEWIIANETIFPFNKKIYFSKEVWFGFIASYFGAIGTILLGIIALWQNKRYKELADKSSDESKKLQTELKELTEKTSEAIKVLEKIEITKYYPSLRKMPHVAINCFDIIFNEYGKDITQQKTYIDILSEDFNQPIEVLKKKYEVLSFVIKNVGEKPLLNFICSKIKVNNEYVNFVSSDCDFHSSQNILISIINLPNLTEVITIDLLMDFSFTTLLMEKYVLKIGLYLNDENGEWNFYFTDFSSPIRV